MVDKTVGGVLGWSIRLKNPTFLLQMEKLRLRYPRLHQGHSTNCRTRSKDRPGPWWFPLYLTSSGTRGQSLVGCSSHSTYLITSSLKSLPPRKGGSQEPQSPRRNLNKNKAYAPPFVLSVWSYLTLDLYPASSLPRAQPNVLAQLLG